MQDELAPPAPPALARWRPLAVRLAVVAGAVAVGLALQRLVGRHFDAIQALAASDVVAARRELATVLRIAALAIAAGAGGLGVAIVASCRRALAEGRFPPSDAWTIGRPREPLTGERAHRLARTGLVLGALLLACALAAGGLLWFLARTLLLCRA